MLTLTDSTNKQDFLAQLSTHTEGYTPLYILVESLPYFINSRVSINILQYQISNFPREIKWYSEDENINSFLQESGLEVEAPSFDTAKAIIPVGNKTIIDVTKGEVIETIEPESTENIQDEEIVSKNTHDTQFDFVQPTPSFGAQNLDTWLDKIETTKEALHSMRPQTEEEPQTYFTPSTKKKWSKSMYLLSTAFVSSVVIVLSILAFPTTAFTLEVQPESGEGSETIILQPRDFISQKVVVDTTVSTDASGQKEVPTERSSGTVSLVNPGNRGVELTNGLFRLIAENKEYDAIPNSSLPQFFTIPARNNINGPNVEIQIQSRNVGDTYNVPENTRFKIVNLLGSSVCGSCYAISTTAIKNTELSGDKIATEADYNVLRNTSESQLAEQRQAKLTEFQTANVFTNPFWFRSNSSEFTFTPEVGVVTNSVSLDVSVQTELYLLERSVIESKIKESNPLAYKIKELDLVESTGEFVDTDSQISLTFWYTFSEENEVNKTTVIETLKSKNCAEAMKAVQAEHPTIKAVECKNTGIQVPGIPKNIDVRIIEQE